MALPAILTGPPFVAEGNEFDKRIEGNLATCAKPLSKPLVKKQLCHSGFTVTEKMVLTAGK